MILIIDDDEFFREDLKSLLEKEGYDVLLANGPDQALSIIEESYSEITAVILDIMMKRGNSFNELETKGGYETGEVLGRHILNKHPDMRLILFSAKDKDDVKFNFNKNNVSFVQKPLSSNIGVILALLGDSTMTDNVEHEEVIKNNPNQSWLAQHSSPLIGAGGAVLAAIIAGAFLLASQNHKELSDPNIIEAPTATNQSSSASEDSGAPNKDNEVESGKENSSPIEGPFELASYKEVYDFAYSPSGMNQTSSAATLFAEKWHRKCSQEPFGQFKEAFKFAYSASGMNMTSGKAKEWAESKTKCLN